ncbi:MAG: DUF4438 domain-containing protein [Desulfobulbaceae bacterium]|nr:DUF4438 domain-containing protein [Desulfobulbaceae bacterium]
MLKTNKDKLIRQSVLGEITSPLGGINPYRISPDGSAAIYPGVGGITYNLRIGEMAGGLFADHVEPGVSISNFTKFAGQDGPNRALNLFSCAGNIAKVISGEALGKTGRVTGKHGGIEHVLIDFEPEVLEELAIGDKIQIKACGCGLQIEGSPVKTMNLDPALLDAIPLGQLEDGRLEVPVTHRIPARIMGSGIGSSHSQSGDYDIQLFDEATIKEFGLDDLRLGDFVAIIDADASFGRIFKTGGVVIGIVVHSNCHTAGHGPGVMVAMSSAEGLITPKIDPKANLKEYFKKL